MESREMKQVILPRHDKSKSLQKLNYSPTFVDCNSEVRLRLGLKCAPKWPVVGRDLTGLKIRSKSVDSVRKTTGKSTLTRSDESDDAKKSKTRIRKKFRQCCATKDCRHRSFRVFAKWFCLSTFVVTTLSLFTFAIIMLSLSNTSTDTRSCDCNWTIDVETLDSELRAEIFGQEVAIGVLMDTLKLRPCKVEPQYARPLILWLHGCSGSGKTLTARILADHYARSGANVHWYIPATEESGDFDKWIGRRSSDCGFDVYVLDDFDSIVARLKANSGFLNGTFRERNVFVVTSVKGSEFLADRLLAVLKRNGSRNDVAIGDLIYQPYSELLNATYVPFLPLEREQLRICVKKTLESRSSPVSDADLNAILNRMKFVPEHFPVFSKTGCKKLQLV